MTGEQFNYTVHKPDSRFRDLEQQVQSDPEMRTAIMTALISALAVYPGLMVHLLFLMSLAIGDFRIYNTMTPHSIEPASQAEEEFIQYVEELYSNVSELNRSQNEEDPI